MRVVLGLVGKSLKHSYSRDIFLQKFRELDLRNYEYKLFELNAINEFPSILEQNEDLKGLNITVPYKQEIMQYLTRTDPIATRIGAVNVVKFEGGGKTSGYNTDYYGFRTSIEKWLPIDETTQVLVLGTGGTSKTVQVVLEDLNINFLRISRSANDGDYSYKALAENPEIIRRSTLIVNTTPLGMWPDVDQAPEIPYDLLSPGHYLFDVIYNPHQSMFLRKGKRQGARTKNGLEMLRLQAEKSWEIWMD